MCTAIRIKLVHQKGGAITGTILGKTNAADIYAYVPMYHKKNHKIIHMLNNTNSTNRCKTQLII